MNRIYLVRHGENYEILFERRDNHLVGQLVTWASFAHLHGPAAELVPGFLEIGMHDS